MTANKYNVFLDFRERNRDCRNSEILSCQIFANYC